MNTTHTTPRIQLTGEQNKILTLPINGPVLIKGCAGSGKTLVAVKRAEHIYASCPDLFIHQQIGIFAYNKEIIRTIQSMLDSGSDIKAQTLDSWIFHFLDLHAQDCCADKQFATAIRVALNAVRVTGKSRILMQEPDFYKDEIAWIKGRLISTQEEYLQTKRTGRGTAVRVTAEDRPTLWKIYEAYQRELASQGIRDWDDRVLDALAKTERPDFKPPFSHLVIDEAQDLSLARITLLSRLVIPETKSVTLIADSAQQIYQSGFSWTDTGLSVVGHSYELKHNYRNTRQIAEAAASLLNHESDTHEFTVMEPCLREGTKPLVLAGSHDFCLAEMIRRIQAVPADETCIIATYLNKEVIKLVEDLKARGISAARISDQNKSARVLVSTFHAMKGLGFAHVFLWKVSRGFFPPSVAKGWGNAPQPAFPDTEDFSTLVITDSLLQKATPLRVLPDTVITDSLLQKATPQPALPDTEDISRFRKLLFVAMTRAQKTLTLVCPGMPSPFIDEIDSTKIDFVLEDESLPAEIPAGQ